MTGTQQLRSEWERQYPLWMIEAFDRWRAGIRGPGAIDPVPFKPQFEWTVEEAVSVAAQQEIALALEAEAAKKGRRK